MSAPLLQHLDTDPQNRSPAPLPADIDQLMAGLGKPAIGPEATDRPADIPELAVIIPTLNERANLPTLIQRLVSVLGREAFEIVVVDDDSPDRTWAVARDYARHDPRIRVIRRVGRRGLAGAAIEGMLATGAPFVALMDGDLQHDETRLPLMLDALRSGRADMVVASRYTENDAVDGFSRSRQQGSRFVTLLARHMLHLDVSDPMSGFFMCRREVVETAAPRLSTQGFKILLDIIASSGPLRIEEIPFTFRSRLSGKSKLDVTVALDCLGLMVAKYTHDLLPIRFLLYAMVGTLGLAAHIFALTALIRTDMGFGRADALATVVVIVFNFLLNNRLTYGDRRLKGLALASGLAVFMAICGIGAVSGVGTAVLLYRDHIQWWAAGVTGAVIGIWWNYAVSAKLVWRA
jgi:dolichol-phosphate mannosyltransferase